jgi:hypothetical protein
LSIEYPTSSVLVQYTTVSVGISSSLWDRSRPSQKNLYGRSKIQQISVLNYQKDGYNLAERTFNPTDPKAMATICKHPRVRIVSRHEDTEFVECLECGDVFDSEEFRDMEIEETAETEEAPNDI